MNRSELEAIIKRAFLSQEAEELPCGQYELCLDIHANEDGNDDVDVVLWSKIEDEDEERVIYLNPSGEERKTG